MFFPQEVRKGVSHSHSCFWYFLVDQPKTPALAQWVSGWPAGEGWAGRPLTVPTHLEEGWELWGRGGDSCFGGSTAEQLCGSRPVPLPRSASRAIV